MRLVDFKLNLTRINLLHSRMNLQRINTFVVLDLETTGLPCYELRRTKITEICLVAASTEHIQNAYNQFSVLPRVLQKINLCVNPCKMIQPISTELTGLHNELLENEQPFNENLCNLLSDFLARLKSPVCLVAHNGVKFDFPILQAEIIKCGRTLPEDILYVDSYVAFRQLLNKQRQSCSGEQIKTVNNLSKSDTNFLMTPELDTIDGSIFKEKFTFELADGTVQRSDLLSVENESVTLVSAVECEDNDLKEKQKINETTPVRNKTMSNVAPYPVKKPNQNPVQDAKFARKRLFPIEYVEGELTPKSFKLKDIYQFLLRKPMMDNHRAESDVTCLLECIVAVCPEFLTWAENNAKMLGEIKKMW